MLSEKLWKPDAVLRLLLSVFMCTYAGSLVISGLQFFQAGGKAFSAFTGLAISALVFLTVGLLIVRKPWPIEGLAKRMVLLLASFYAALVLGAFAQKLAGPTDHTVAQMVVSALSFQGASLLLIRRFLREHQSDWTTAFGFAHRWVHALLFGVILACLFLPVGRLLHWLSFKTLEQFPQLPVKPHEQEAVQTIRVATTWAEQLMSGVVTILLVPVAEEMLFRGIIYPWIKHAGYPRLALWITSLLFAAVHANWMIFLPLLILALLLTMLYELSNNLLAPITAHALFNAMNFALLYLSDPS